MRLFLSREMRKPWKCDFPGNGTFQENLKFLGKFIFLGNDLNLFMQTFISREVRIPGKLDFSGKF